MRKSSIRKLPIDFNDTVAFPVPYRNLRSGLEWSGRDFIIQKAE